MLTTLLLEKFFFRHTTQLAGSQFPDQGLNLDHSSGITDS